MSKVNINSVLNCLWRYRYIIIICIGLLTTLVLSSDSVWNNFMRYTENARLQAEVDSFKAEYDAYTRELQLLDTDVEEVERIAREKHHMKRADEDLFLYIKEAKR